MKYSLVNQRFSICILFDLFTLTALPFITAIAIHYATTTPINGLLLGRWFVFWTIGVRLMVAGLTEVMSSRRQGNIIFLQGSESGEYRKIIGYLKILLAALGFLCMIKAQSSLIAALTAGIYLGLTGFRHDFKKPCTAIEWLYLGYDIIVFFVIITCLVF